MADGLRKGLTSYGDAGFSLFLRKAFIKAMGYSDDALDRPIVGITNTYSDYNPCHGNVPQIIEAVKRGVMLAGAMPMVFPTISIHESFAYPTSMFLRNLMAMDTEEMIRAQPMDAVVLIGGCDKTLPAQMMAAVSADLPTVVIRSGRCWSAITRARCSAPAPIAAGCGRKYRAGEIDEAEIEAVNGRLAPSVGTCMVMGTASTMACMTEALGLSLPMARRSRRRMPSGCARRSQRQGRRRDGDREGAEAQRNADARPRSATRRWCCRRSAARPTGSSTSPRSPAALGIPHRPRSVRQARPRGAGAGRPEALGRALHGAFPPCRRRAALMRSSAT